MVGEWDQLVPKYLSERLASAIPGATLKILPGGHAEFIEQPEPYNVELLRLLQRGTHHANPAGTQDVNSPAYQQAKQHRLTAADVELFIIDGGWVPPEDRLPHIDNRQR